MPLRASLTRSLQYAMANMADIKTPLCALQPTPAIPHTASRSGAGTRGGSAGSSGRRRGAARHGARVPPTPGPPSDRPPAWSRLASPRFASPRPASPAPPAPPGRLAPAQRPARAKERRARRPRGPTKGRRVERLGMLGPASWSRAPVTAGRPRRASAARRGAAQCGRSRDLEIKTHAKSQANSLSRTELLMKLLTGSASSRGSASNPGISITTTYIFSSKVVSSLIN